MKPPESLDRDALVTLVRRLVPDWHADRVVIDRHLPGGYAHANYRIRHGEEYFALRAPGDMPDPQTLAFEARWFERLPADLGADIVAFDPGSGALLSRWIDAPLLVDRPATAEDLVNYLVTLHQRLPAAERDYDLPFRVDTWLRGRAIHSAVARARARLRGGDDAYITAHNDLNPWNILCTAPHWRTLDWEWAGRNDPLFDLVTLVIGADNDDRRLEGIARQYAERMHLETSSLADRLANAVSAFWLREFAWAEAALSDGNRRLEVTAQRERSLEKLLQL